MFIKLIPQRRDDVLEVFVKGDAITLNGVEYDFSQLPEGAVLPTDAVMCEWILGDIERIGGTIQLSLLMPHGNNAPESVCFPSPIITEGDGRVSLPTDIITFEEEEVV